MSRRDGGGEDGDDGCKGEVGEMFNRSDKPINMFDMSVVRKLC